MSGEKSAYTPAYTTFDKSDVFSHFGVIVWYNSDTLEDAEKSI